MAEINEQNELYPSIEEIEGVALAELDQTENALMREENEIDRINGMGDIGRSQKAPIRKKHKGARKQLFSRAVRKAYAQGAKGVALKIGLTDNLTSKGQFELRRGQLPKDVQKALKEARLQTVDTAIYAIKPIANKSDIDLMEASDDRKAGRTNLNRSQLDSGKYFLLTAIVLEYAHGESEGDNDPADYAFGQFALPPAVINGTFEMTLGTKVIVPEISCGVFDDSNTKKRKFMFKLDNPKWLKPQMDITPTLSMPKAVAGEDVHNPAVKVTLLGTMTEKA